MGTDIHAVFQAKKNGQWVDLKSEWDEQRHYMLFAWLADVRNGFGFAGITTHDPVTPIAEKRGYPDDFQVDDDVHVSPLGFSEFQDEVGGRWLGDHSHSWLTADEILAAPVPKPTRSGVITIEQYREWDGEQPSEWVGDCWGGKVLVSAPDSITDKTTHVRVSWPCPNGEFDYFLDEIRRLRDEHGEVRMVFGFDS